MMKLMATSFRNNPTSVKSFMIGPAFGDVDYSLEHG
jgi:hypothetical protein